MSKVSEIEDQVSAILNPPLHEKYTEKRDWAEFSLVKENSSIRVVNIVDLKGKKFRFPGKFIMERNGDEITFKAVKP